MLAAIETHDVPYGPEHAATMRALLGDGYRTIAQSIYEQPYRQTIACADGRYALAMTTKYGFSTHLVIYPDYATMDASYRATMAAVPDPETGRRPSCKGYGEYPVDGNHCPICGAQVLVFAFGRSKGRVEPHTARCGQSA
jgi:hypothetical protein